MNALGTIAIAIMGVVGCLVIAQAMSEYSRLRCPKLIAALVATLGCIGLIPFTALMIAGSVIWAATRFSGRWSERGKRPKPVKTTKLVEQATPNVSHNPWRIAK